MLPFSQVKQGGVTGCVWNWANGANVPTLAQWDILKPLLNLSNEFLPLIERIEAEREVIGTREVNGEEGTAGGYQNGIASIRGKDVSTKRGIDITIAKTDEAKQWEGWGTALKPAMELWTLCRKPLEEKTVAENVLKHGTGGINIDGCRVEIDKNDDIHAKNPHTVHIKSNLEFTSSNGEPYKVPTGRFPANLIHDGSDEVVGLFPQTKSGGGNKNSVNNQKDSFLGTGFGGTGTKTDWEVDSGSAARFFYCAKASKGERNKGLEGFEEVRHADRNKSDGVGGDNPRNRTNTPKQNFHPTVKPVKLMQYLCKLITPKEGIVLDCFMGSGTTGIAAKLEGFDFIGIEREEEYLKIARARINAWEVEPQLNMI